VKKLRMVVAILAAFPASSIHVCSQDRPPLEKQVGDVLCAHVEMFANKNSGAWPTNWAQLTTLAKFEQQLFRDRHVLLPEIYIFAPTNLPLAGFRNSRNYEGALILIQGTPTKEHDLDGRNFVYYDSSIHEFRLG